MMLSEQQLLRVHLPRSFALIHIFSATQVFSVIVFVGLVFSFPDLFVSPVRLYDKSKHFELRRLNHSFVVFCEGPCSRCVAYRRSYCCVE